MAFLVVQMGNGKIARVHRDNFPLGTKVIAIVVRDVEKHRKNAAFDPTVPSDVLITADLKEVLRIVEGKSVIWDISSDDHTHAGYLRNILDFNPQSSILLAKSPVSEEGFAELESFRANYPESRICLLEN